MRTVTPSGKDGVGRRPYLGRRSCQPVVLGHGQLEFDHFAHALWSQTDGHPEADAMEAVLTLEHRRAGDRVVGSGDQGAHGLAQADARDPSRRAPGLERLVRREPRLDVACHGGFLFGREVGRCAPDGHPVEERHLQLAVLAEDQGAHVGRPHAERAGDGPAQAHGVVAREPHEAPCGHAGPVRERAGEDVDRVGGDDHRCVGAVSRQVCRGLAHDGDVARQVLVPRGDVALGHARRQDDDVAAGQVGPAAAAHPGVSAAGRTGLGPAEVGQRQFEVHRVGPCDVVPGVDEDDLVDPAQRRGVECGGRAHGAATPHKADLHGRVAPAVWPQVTPSARRRPVRRRRRP